MLISVPFHILVFRVKSFSDIAYLSQKLVLYHSQVNRLYENVTRWMQCIVGQDLGSSPFLLLSSHNLWTMHAFLLPNVFGDCTSLRSMSKAVSTFALCICSKKRFGKVEPPQSLHCSGKSGSCGILRNDLPGTWVKLDCRQNPLNHCSPLELMPAGQVYSRVVHVCHLLLVYVEL